MSETSERATCKNCGVGIGDCGKRPRHRFRLVSEEMPSSSAEPMSDYSLSLPPCPECGVTHAYVLAVSLACGLRGAMEVLPPCLLCGRTEAPAPWAFVPINGLTGER